MPFNFPRKHTRERKRGYDSHLLSVWAKLMEIYAFQDRNLFWTTRLCLPPRPQWLRFILAWTPGKKGTRLRKQIFQLFIRIHALPAWRQLPTALHCCSGAFHCSSAGCCWRRWQNSAAAKNCISFVPHQECRPFGGTYTETEAWTNVTVQEDSR